MSISVDIDVLQLISFCLTVSSGDWDDSDDESSDERKSRRAPPRRVAASKSQKSLKSRSKTKRIVCSSSESESESDNESRRQKTRRSAQKKVSYKEQSDHTDSDDLVEVDWTNYEAEAEEVGETVERILEHRMGKKGATGLATAPYEVELNGDPNDEKAEEKEMQFLVKWKGWSHLHNTWETEDSLKEANAKGIKKLENYWRREEEIKNW